MEKSAPLINVTVNDAVFHTNSHINQMPPQIVHIHAPFSGRLAPPDFVGQGCSAATNLKFILSDWKQRMMHRMSGYTQLAEKITTSSISENDRDLM